MAEREVESMMALEVKDGESSIRFCEGQSFGAHRSVAGERVFQTGMVGYPESITDPSYRGQILVITFPLVGNYGVPSREDRDAILKDVPSHFESSEIHIAGLVVASYSGEDYSHHLATSSLGTWLKEQNVPAIYGVDTRALTKRIRGKRQHAGSPADADWNRTGNKPGLRCQWDSDAQWNHDACHDAVHLQPGCINWQLERERCERCQWRSRILPQVKRSCGV